MAKPHSKHGRRERQDGAILLVVLLLVIMFTGLGLLAMRHTQFELRSAGSYLDSTQAASLAESAIAMVATDMRRNWDIPPGDNYKTQFTTSTLQSGIHLRFSPKLDPGMDHDAGVIPDDELSGRTPLALTPTLSAAFADIAIEQRSPILAPPEKGFSTTNDNRNYDWYYFEMKSEASYGAPLTNAASALYARGRAAALSRIMIGPITAIGR
ncbi:MAG: hypothetical protein PHU25_05835 [Deltaproteobacteria bacterium]|nr:hypothetical protein [Deltaproteobacteria bacterium]